MWYSRLGVGRLVAFKGMVEIVFVVHVALGAQVVVEAHFALPPHSHDAMLLAAVADNIGVTHPCEKGRSGEGGKETFKTVFRSLHIFISASIREKHILASNMSQSVK